MASRPAHRPTKPEAEQRWEYRLHFPGGGAFGGAPLTLTEVLAELRHYLPRSPIVRCEIKPYQEV
jgi:hypothetical protein